MNFHNFTVTFLIIFPIVLKSVFRYSLLTYVNNIFIIILDNIITYDLQNAVPTKEFLMPRPNKPRRVCQLPAHTHFFSQEYSTHTTKQGLLLSIEEYETIRLLDYMGMTQQEAAEQMGTGRTTVQALYIQARRKFSRFLVEGTPLTIEGGSYQLCSRQLEGTSYHPCPRQSCSRLSGSQKTNCIRKMTVSGKERNHMKIAVTYENGQVFQHFGHTEQFKVYEVEDGKIISSEIVDTNGQGHGALAGFLFGGGVDVLICGGIGGGARNALAEAGIQLYPGATGDADAQVESFLKGQLVYDPDTMCSHHSHEEGHSCGDHGCGSHSCH